MQHDIQVLSPRRAILTYLQAVSREERGRVPLGDRHRIDVLYDGCHDFDLSSGPWAGDARRRAECET